MRRLTVLCGPLVAVVALATLPGDGEAGWRCWRRARQCPTIVVCPPAATVAVKHVVSKKTGRMIAIYDTGEAEREETDIQPKSVFAKKSGKVDEFNSFIGKVRRMAKVSLAAAMEDPPFDSVGALLKTLKDDDEMADMMIPRTLASDRVAVERRNVRVRAFIYAFKKEADNDYHVIIGDPPGTPSGFFFNVEVSGLPTADDAPTAETKQKLTAVRTAFKTFFDLGNTGPSSYQKPDPPVEVVIAGSLFWDVEHWPNTVGPTAFKPKRAWEIHPISFIEFEP